jgi:hypothetical protein
MKTTSMSLHDRCAGLFVRYPEAVDFSRSIVIATKARGGEFFVLTRLESGDFFIWRWPDGEEATVAPATESIPSGLADALACGVPLPRNGSLLGWRHGGVITAMITVCTRLESGTPSWSVMPLAGSPQDRWPPFSRERLLGAWFWDHYRAGRVVDLAPVVAGTYGTVFWVPAEVAPGSGYCIVAARDVRSRDGWTLPAGRYVYWRPLREGRAVPSLEVMLADPGRADLAPRFAGCPAAR